MAMSHANSAANLNVRLDFSCLHVIASNCKLLEVHVTCLYCKIEVYRIFSKLVSKAVKKKKCQMVLICILPSQINFFEAWIKDRVMKNSTALLSASVVITK